MRKQPTVSQEFEVHPDNPFRDTWQQMIKTAKTATRSSEVNNGLTTERMTIVMEKTYLPFGFAKIYQNKKLLDLSHYACKVLVHMALNMEYQQQLIKLTAGEVGLERRSFSKAILELITADVLRKQKREWYWINITVMVVGRLKQIDG